MLSITRVHKENHKTLNCEKCGSEYCTEKVDLYEGGKKYKVDCGYHIILGNYNVETKGLCEFCYDKKI